MKLGTFLIILIVFASAAISGCAEQTSENYISESPSGNTSDIITSDIITPTEQEELVNITASEVQKSPKLNIVSVTPEDYGINIKVKNVGNASAQDVYCGVLLYGASNKIAYSEYVTIDILRDAVVSAVRGGPTGNTYDYDTGYVYKDTPNLTISSRVIGVDFMGDMEPGQTCGSSIDIVDFGTGRSEFLKVAWVAGDEANLTIW